MHVLQFTYPFTGNYFIHEGRKAIRSKGAIKEHFIINEIIIISFHYQSESNRYSIAMFLSFVV